MKGLVHMMINSWRAFAALVTWSPPCSEGLGGACLRLVTQSCIALDGIEIKDPSITTTTGIPIDPHFGHQQGSTVDTFSFLVIQFLL
ncbi:hypothetical protein RHGRI_008173 [Rhododendron griersonianum]|uniref:Secreted protein n=1 Tax=Rhododendron griersonianum TaxID=479676 RepID=A0AAV6KZE5_9ERIC|nr:hypothetical protein RHGRI_008173 [Rhododendron griersonianum]